MEKKQETLHTTKTISIDAENQAHKTLHTFKEIIDEAIKENKNNHQKAKEPIINEVLREAKKAFKQQDYQEIKMYAVQRLVELGFSMKELKPVLE